MFAWIALIAAFTGAGVVIEGLAPRTAWAQSEVFVTNYLGDSVTTYSRSGRGFLAPLRTISGPDTGLLAPAGLVVDTVNNELLVANIASITVHRLTASGNAAPLRTIAGPDTDLNQPIGLAVDTTRKEILVANVSTITVYSLTAGGPLGSPSANVKWVREISGPSTGLMDPFGLAMDAARGHLLVANFGNNTITVYGPTASGDARPLRTIGGPDTGLQKPIGLAVDGNEVLVANEHSITAYSLTAGGPAGSPAANVKPLRTISGALTGLNHPLGLGLDANDVLVANFGANTVAVYARKPGGNVAPLRVIEGVATDLDGPAFPVVAATCPSAFDFDFSGNAYARCFRDLLRGDQITAGLDLGAGPRKYTSLNVQGSSGATPTTWLTVYDATPTSAAPGPTFGAQTLCADVLTVPFDNIKGGGVVALLNEGAGKKGLALVIHDAGNTDALLLATVDGDPKEKGKLVTLASVPLDAEISRGNWYRLIMTVDPDPANSLVTGRVFRHTTPSDPNSALGGQVGATLTYRPAVLPVGVTSPGESGILASSINAVLKVSVTNFSNSATQCGP